MREVFVVIALTCCTCGCDLCRDEMKDEQISPDPEIVATAYVRNCGTTTPFTFDPSIHEKSESYDDRENIVLIVKGSYAVHVQWVGPKNLLVRCPECNQDDVFKQVAVWQGIEVAFELAPAK